MNTQEAARRWAEVWTRAWPARDVQSIAALYADNTRYLSYPFREPDEGIAGARDYLTRTLNEEDNIECWFGEPVAGEDTSRGRVVGELDRGRRGHHARGHVASAFRRRGAGSRPPRLLEPVRRTTAPLPALVTCPGQPIEKYSTSYRGCRERVTEMVTGLADDDLARRVPACPDWTVRDLTAHIIGVAADLSVGNLEQMGAHEWTSAQIAKRKDHSVTDLIEEWTKLAEEVEPTADLIPPGAAQMLVGDAVTHEHDMRGALNRPGARDTDAVWIGLDRYIRVFGKRIKDAELSSVVVRSGDREWQAGIREPEAKS